MAPWGASNRPTGRTRGSGQTNPQLSEPPLACWRPSVTSIEAPQTPPMLTEIAIPSHASSAEPVASRPDHRGWLAAAGAATGLALGAAALYLPLAIPAGWSHLFDGPARLGAAALIG